MIYANDHTFHVNTELRHQISPWKLQGLLFTGERFVSCRDGDFDIADTQLADAGGESRLKEALSVQSLPPMSQTTKRLKLAY